MNACIPYLIVNRRVGSPKPTLKVVAGSSTPILMLGILRCEQRGQVLSLSRCKSKRRTRPVTYGERRQVNGENKSWKGAGTNNDVHSADGTVEGSPSGDMVYQGSLEPNCINVEVGGPVSY